MKKPTELKPHNKLNPDLLTLNDAETFRKFWLAACKGCACRLNCTRKDLCCYLHAENLPITERFICRLEKLFQVCFYYAVHANGNIKLAATQILSDTFAEALPALHANYTACLEELRGEKLNYTRKMLNTVFNTYLCNTECEAMYEALYGELTD